MGNSMKDLKLTVGIEPALSKNQVPTVNRLYFYTIVFNYGNDEQQYLSESKNGLCFVDNERYPLKIYGSYEKAKQVMDGLASNSFTNEGALQVCSIILDAVGEPSKGNPKFLGGLFKKKE